VNEGSTNSQASALRTLDIELAGLTALRDSLGSSLGDNFREAVEAIYNSRGRVAVTGMGKSGHVGRKIAATLASTGTPALFIHPGEASHGDLGMITEHDVVLGLSWSGETAEFRSIIDYVTRFKIIFIAVASNPESALGRAATILLALPRVEEACPNRLAPTTSTTLQIVLGDAIALALLERRGFSADQFKVFHPGGKLGSVLVRVADLMHAGSELPIVTSQTRLPDALLAMSAGRMGCVVVVGDKDNLVGILTDGDLRRAAVTGNLAGQVKDFMTHSPVTIRPKSLPARRSR
jgi:arabinose-5-phosphate isomerase